MFAASSWLKLVCILVNLYCRQFQVCLCLEQQFNYLWCPISYTWRVCWQPWHRWWTSRSWWLGSSERQAKMWLEQNIIYLFYCLAGQSLIYVKFVQAICYVVWNQSQEGEIRRTISRLERASRPGRGTLLLQHCRRIYSNSWRRGKNEKNICCKDGRNENEVGGKDF